MIVDNKMSNKEVKQNSIVAGLQLQLPLYIRAARLGLDGYEAAGGLYQPIKDVLVGSEDADQINTQIDKDLQTSGMILDEEQVQEAAKPVKIAKRLDTNDTVSAVSAEEMYAVEDCAIGAVADRVTLIYKGEASPSLSRMEWNHPVPGVITRMPASMTALSPDARSLRSTTSGELRLRSFNGRGSYD